MEDVLGFFSFWTRVANRIQVTKLEFDIQVQAFWMQQQRRRLTSMAVRSAAVLAISVFGVGLSAGVAVLGCSGASTQTANPLRYTEDARRAYDKALEVFLDHDWEEARTLMQEVKRKYSYSRYARLAELRLADIDFEQEKFASAITAYRAFAHDHRTDENVPYSRFRICRALYNQISDTIMLPPQEERDQAATVDAYRELTSFISDHANTKWSKEARFMLLMVTGRLVRHELYVARYYLRKDNFDAATNRIRYALRKYDGSGLEPEAMVLLAETYLKMKKTDEAREVLNQFMALYSASPFEAAARNFLTQLDGTTDSESSLPLAPSRPPALSPQ